EELASAPAEAEASVLADRRQRLDQITARFKKVSGALLPLGKERVLLDSVRANLSQWESASEGAYGAVARSLAIHAALLAALIALLLAGSVRAPRATFRYARDPRRRQASLLVRRIVVTFAVTIAVVFSLVNEIGSLATF